MTKRPAFAITKEQLVTLLVKCHMAQFTNVIQQFNDRQIDDTVMEINTSNSNCGK